MTKNSSLTLLVSFIILTIACKKQDIHNDQLNEPVKESSISLTPTELESVNKLIDNKDWLGVNMFVSKIEHSNLRAVNQNLSVTPDNTSPATDNMSTFSTARNESLPTFYSLGENGSLTYSTRFQQILTFPIRRNQVQIFVPYLIKYYPNTGELVSVSRTPDGYPQILPLGGNWGEVTQSPPGTFNSVGFIGSQAISVTIGALASEKRTQIRSATGQVKISTNVNLAAFEVGSEIEAGFTVQSAQNIYNNYTMDARGTINLNRSGSFITPDSYFQGTITCVDYGILANQ